MVGCRWRAGPEARYSVPVVDCEKSLSAIPEATGESLPVRLPGQVTLPGELDAALKAGNLAVFVGAGVSRDDPSGLPDFPGMAKQIAAMAGQADLVDGPNSTDVVLGDLQDGGFDVHGAVRDIIGDPKSKPNDWHRALMGLWGEEDKARIVTTNYDTHLETAADGDLAVWAAPALPLGSDFAGLVHLHGSLAGPDNGLVVTDRDFGRAYLTEGWARRFLVDFFSQFVVLFVGYSHTDLVMQYLARGLPPGGRRFALIRASDDLSEWERRRIRPVTWEEEPEDAFGPGLAALEEWGRLQVWSYVDQERYIQELVSAGMGIPSKCGDFHYEEMTWQIHEGSMTRSSGPVL